MSTKLLREIKKMELDEAFTNSVEIEHKSTVWYKVPLDTLKRLKMVILSLTGHDKKLCVSTRRTRNIIKVLVIIVCYFLLNFIINLTYGIPTNSSEAKIDATVESCKDILNKYE